MTQYTLFEAARWTDESEARLRDILGFGEIQTGATVSDHELERRFGIKKQDRENPGVDPKPYFEQIYRMLGINK